MKRKFQLHSLAEEQKKEDIKSLYFLLNLTVAKKDVVTERSELLKSICVKHGINHPLIGEKLYDPMKFDYSKLSTNYGNKIRSLCAAEKDTFYKYKLDSQEVLEIKVGRTPSQIEARNREFNKVRA